MSKFKKVLVAIVIILGIGAAVLFGNKFLNRDVENDDSNVVPIVLPMVEADSASVVE